MKYVFEIHGAGGPAFVVASDMMSAIAVWKKHWEESDLYRGRRTEPTSAEQLGEVLNG